MRTRAPHRHSQRDRITRKCLTVALPPRRDRAGEGVAYGNLGNAYRSQGDYAKAIDYHKQCLAIAKEMGDRAGEGKAYGNLGNAYRSQGDNAKAIEYHAQHLAIEKEGRSVREPWHWPHALERVRQSRRRQYR
jgi:tetratricopeptide (TPR) repeat protein